MTPVTMNGFQVITNTKENNVFLKCLLVCVIAVGFNIGWAMWSWFTEPAAPVEHMNALKQDYTGCESLTIVEPAVAVREVIVVYVQPNSYKGFSAQFKRTAF